MVESAGSGLDLGDLIRNLGLVAGVVTKSGDGGKVDFNQDWFHDPIADLRAMPGDPERREALVGLLEDVLPEPVKNPALTSAGLSEKTKWFPLPRPKTGGESAEQAAIPGTGGGGGEADPETEPSGVFLTADPGDEALAMGLGLLAETEIDGAKIKAFANFPLVSLPSAADDPVLFIGHGGEYPVLVGVEVAAPDNAIKYQGDSYDTLHVEAGFDATEVSGSTVALFVRAGDGEPVPIPLHFPTITEIVNVVLGLDAVSSWLDKSVVPGNSTAPGVGKILVAFGLLTKGGDEEYKLGSLEVVRHLTLLKLLENALSLLAGLRLFEIHGDESQGLFIEVREDDDTGAKHYGLRLTIRDIQLSGTDESDKATLTLQLGKGFEEAPAKGQARAPAAAAGASATDGEPGGDEDGGNWTNSDQPLGVSLLLLEQNGDHFSFRVGLALVSVGIDYSKDGPEGLVNAKGFQFSGVEPRIYLTVGDKFAIGAACRVDDLELPLDATFGEKSAESNPVANNLLESKDSGGSSESGDKTTPAARTKFSASAALDAKESFHATLYDAERKPTTEPIWFKVEKAFGPVALQKIGIAWADPKRELSFLVDGGLETSGLSVELDSLSITFPVQNMADTRLGLKGMSIAYQAGAVDISGGFVEIDTDEGVEYEGEALIKAAGFSISALGAYGVLDGHPSLFVFALIDIPLGGPPVFFIDGFAGGFGYNRGLRLPTLDELPTYPLVQGAMAGPGPANPFSGKNDPAGALAVLSEDTPPRYGEDWVAAGVRFASFELIQSFALLTVKFGAEFEIDLLGLSQASIPPLAADPIANAELALRVTFAPDRGFFGVSAKLTDQSYILSRSCHLTGGFAFYLWFKDDPETGAPAGQFVVTLGGYNPYFTSKPSYYPDEPRVGANWQVSTALSIKGGLYFALTPGAVMAGGFLDAMFDASIVSAWFKAHADFLLGWKPFYYEISAGIDLGARIRLPILVATISITIEVGVDLKLWGPEFGGGVTVHLLFISFTIPFGSSHPEPLPIDWKEFAASFLPSAKQSHSGDQTGPAAAGTTAKPDNVCGVRVSVGLLKDLAGDASTAVDWLVDPIHMQLELFSLIPSKSIELVTKAGTVTSQIAPGEAAKEFGVGPMAVQSEHFSSTLSVRIEYLKEGAPDPEYDFAQHILPEPRLGAAPRATWDVAAAFNRSIKGLNGAPLTIANVAHGAALTAVEAPPDHTPLPIAVASLQGTLDPRQGHFDWAGPRLPDSNPFARDQDRSIAELMETIADPSGPVSRSAIVASLASNGVSVTTDIDVSGLAAHANEVLLEGPFLCPLGFAGGQRGTDR